MPMPPCVWTAFCPTNLAERETFALARLTIALRSAKFVGQNAVQTHGGIGITQELAIGHYFKRATMIEGQFGSADWHLDRYEQLTLSDGA